MRKNRIEREIEKDGKQNIKRAERSESWRSVKSERMRCRCETLRASSCATSQRRQDQRHKDSTGENKEGERENKKEKEGETRGERGRGREKRSRVDRNKSGDVTGDKTRRIVREVAL